MSVLNDDGSGTSFINITAQASDPSTTVSLFQGTAVGNVVYIGGDFEFFGIKTLTNTPWGAGDSALVALEYWNGAWTVFDYMVTNSIAPFDVRTTLIFETAGSEQVRFNNLSGWIQRTVDSINKFWVRIRVTSIISLIPIINQIKLHTNRTEINSSGYREYFGNARTTSSLAWDVGLLEPANSSPGNGDVYVSDNLNVGRVENLFADGTIDRSGFNAYLPENVDTSIGIKFRWSWSSTVATGNVEWVIRWGFTNDGFSVFPSAATAPPVGPNEQSITLVTAAPGTSNTQKNESVILVITTFNPQPLVGDPDMIWLTIQRTGNAVADTLAGSLRLIQIQGVYMKWNDGGYFTTF